MLYLNAFWQQWHAQVVVRTFIPKIYTLPPTPTFFVNYVQVFVACVVRIQDQKLDISCFLIIVDAENSMR